MNCKVCGNKLADGAQVCELCGSRVEAASVQTAQLEMLQKTSNMNDNSETFEENTISDNVNFVEGSSYSEHPKYNKTSDVHNRRIPGYQINLKLLQGITVVIVVVIIGIIIICNIHSNGSPNNVTENEMITVKETYDISDNKYTLESEKDQDYVNNFPDDHNTSNLSGANSDYQAEITADDQSDYIAIEGTELKITDNEVKNTSSDKDALELEQNQDYAKNTSNAHNTDSVLNGADLTFKASIDADDELDYTAVEDVESKVKAIREEYYKTQNNVSTLAISDIGKYKFYRNAQELVERVDFPFDNEYSACFYYKNNQLYFAFVFDSTLENRFYFYNNTLFRWIDESKEIHDNDFSNSNYQSWWDDVINEAELLAEYL